MCEGKWCNVPKHIAQLILALCWGASVPLHGDTLLFFFLAGLCAHWNKWKMEAVNMSFALVSYYLPATGHSGKKKKKGKNKKSVHWEHCLCSVVGLARMKQVWKAPKQKDLEGKVKSAGFPLLHGILRIEFWGCLWEFLTVVVISMWILDFSVWIVITVLGWIKGALHISERNERLAQGRGKAVFSCHVIWTKESVA